MNFIDYNSKNLREYFCLYINYIFFFNNYILIFSYNFFRTPYQNGNTANFAYS